MNYIINLSVSVILALSIYCTPILELDQYLVQNYKWKIEIPAIELEANIAEGTTKEILDTHVGHFENTKKTNGNIGLAAHNRGYKVNYFNNIKNLKIGEEVYYQCGFIKKKYIVFSVHLISDEDWSFLQNTKENTITMITCVENMPSLRYCVQAKQM